MEAIKNQLMELKKTAPGCTENRQRLRAVLSDSIPNEKQLINSILISYDEDIEKRLTSGSDRTLQALQLINILKNDYGMTENSAVNAIKAWCYILGFEEVADALSIINTQPDVSSHTNGQSASDTRIVSAGIYMAGVDFPEGIIRLNVVSLSEGKKQNFYAIYQDKPKGGTDTLECNYFVQQATLKLLKGQRLRIDNGKVELTVVSEINR